MKRIIVMLGLIIALAACAPNNKVVMYRNGTPSEVYYVDPASVHLSPAPNDNQWFEVWRLIKFRVCDENGDGTCTWHDKNIPGMYYGDWWDMFMLCPQAGDACNDIVKAALSLDYPIPLALP